MPFFGGMEPYTYLLDSVMKRVMDPRAVREFPYDWRLSIEYNADRLAEVCVEHFEAWKQTFSRHRDPYAVRIAIVAHSMGGLVARYAMIRHGLEPIVRHLITLGTPYYGAVKAVQMLITGEGAPVPRRAARHLALSSPGIYDLLPRYRCWADGLIFRPIDAGTLTAHGAPAEMLTEAAGRWSSLQVGGPEPVPLYALVGVDQPTLQSVEASANRLRFLDSLDGIDYGGDSTVFRHSAAPAGTTAIPLPQKHGTLAKTPEAVAFVLDKLVGADVRPPLVAGNLGADIPDLVMAGEMVTVSVRIADRHTSEVEVTSTALDSGLMTFWGREPPADDGVVEFGDLHLAPGLHRVEVTARGGESSPVISDIVLALPW
jgi:pimeloyl-ACP methyl ester carboxylesterase